MRMDRNIDTTDTKDLVQPAQQTYIQEVVAVFPDICLRFLQSIAQPSSFNSQIISNQIVDLLESGQTYPKREHPKKPDTKRKRDSDGEDGDLAEKVREIKRFYTVTYRDREPQPKQQSIMTGMIAGDFPLVPERVIRKAFAENNFLLLPTYLNVGQATQRDEKTLPWTYKKTPTPQDERYKKRNIKHTMKSVERSSEDGKRERKLMKELQAARFVHHHTREASGHQGEEEGFDNAQSKDETKECGCCFTNTAKDRMVHCDGDDAHFFCISCARRNAEMQVGSRKHELKCLSIDACRGGYSRKQRQRFVTRSLETALDSIEQEESLRLAKLPDLALCPFCTYAEEYPPVNVDKEFRCRKSDCMVTSCRLCKLVSHVPKSCKEAALEHGRDSRRQVEEAMSKALIRSCNKSESGDRPSSCPLFEDSEKRHSKEVQEAEKNAKQKVLEENPDLDPESLEFTISSKVKKDDARRMRKSANTYEARHRPYLGN
ncbi:uncharacterized protein FIESC28_10009 [Fusarium coffeatum]|uniref:RING-type domain-containing protein n=1 Tax=Fusarium coffeatum TaxID=231269 RepID=A0A366QW85_9HYPO|nr:uncharacterized protein FIESC28_10009 [Fusarium coffeatum]RBR09159.1 hypothetical protein FIESC28_10009 [Fusarium coffeatum]